MEKSTKLHILTSFLLCIILYLMTLDVHLYDELSEAEYEAEQLSAWQPNVVPQDLDEVSKALAEVDDWTQKPYVAPEFDEETQAKIDAENAIRAEALAKYKGHTYFNTKSRASRKFG